MMIISAKEGHGHGVYMTDSELISNLAVFFIAGKYIFFKKKTLLFKANIIIFY